MSMLIQSIILFFKQAGLVKVQLSLRCQSACVFLPVLTALPALAVAPQPIQAKVAVGSAASSPSATLVAGLEVAPVGDACSAVNEGEKNTWVYLEELANTLMSNVQQLKALIEQAKNGAGEPAGVKGHGSRKEVRPTQPETLRIR